MNQGLFQNQYKTGKNLHKTRKVNSINQMNSNKKSKNRRELGT
jgi:hypothetical protein